MLTDIHMPGLDGIEATQTHPAQRNHGAEETHAHRSADRRRTRDWQTGLPGRRHGWFSHQADRYRRAGRHVRQIVSARHASRTTPPHDCNRARASHVQDLFQSAHARHAGARIFVRIAVAADGQHVRLLAARRRHFAHRHRISFPGSASPTRSNFSGRRSIDRAGPPFLGQLGPPARLDAGGADHGRCGTLWRWRPGDRARSRGAWRLRAHRRFRFGDAGHRHRRLAN